MHVTLIGTGNMTRGIGSRVLAGGHELTIVGKDAQRAEAVAADIGGEGTVRTAVIGDPIEGEVAVLAVYYPDARGAVEQYADSSPGTSSSTSRIPSTRPSTGLWSRPTAPLRTSSRASPRARAS
jgi:predicted dinucleotide-binding enzyme